MGLIRALKDSIGGGLADSWLESYESVGMTPNTVMCPGVRVRKGDKRDGNTKGTDNTISNGSIIHVEEGQFMMLIDGGKIVDYTAEAGYFKVDNSSLPSLFNGQLLDSVKETFNRFRFSGTTPLQQRIVYINMQEIRDIKFGTPNPVNYFDNFYNSELFLRSFGTYSIKIVDPIKFYIQVADHSSREPMDINIVNEQYRNEFLQAFQSALNRMSTEGIRISHVVSKQMELGEYMQDVLDSKWNDERGFEIQSVGIASISYTEESQKLINMRNQGAMLSDPTVREGYVQGAVARGFEAAGSNSAGAGQTFMGMGIGMNAVGGIGGFSQANAQQMQQQSNAQQASQQQAASQQNVSQEQNSAPAPDASKEAPTQSNDAAGVVAGQASVKEGWECPECHSANTGKFCTECGTKKPEDPKECPNCHVAITNPNAKFCTECGTKLN